MNTGLHEIRLMHDQLLREAKNEQLAKIARRNAKRRPSLIVRTLALLAGLQR